MKVLARAGVGEKSGVLAMHLAGLKPMLRRHAMMLALLIACFAAADRAQATCTPITTPLTPLSNAAVDCTDATHNQNGTIGFGTSNDSGNTITVKSGASVTGDFFGVLAPGTATVINQGTGIITGREGIGGSGGLLTVDNSGFVAGVALSVGDVGVGIDSNSLSLTNRMTGTITGNDFGIFASNVVTVNNSGLIGVTVAGGIAIGRPLCQRKQFSLRLDSGRQ